MTCTGSTVEKYLFTAFMLLARAPCKNFLQQFLKFCLKDLDSQKSSLVKQT